MKCIFIVDNHDILKITQLVIFFPFENEDTTLAGIEPAKC